MTRITNTMPSFHYQRDVTEPISQLAVQMRESGVPVDLQGLETECRSLKDSNRALQEAVDCAAGRPIKVSDAQRLTAFLRDEVGLSIESGRTATYEELDRHKTRHPIIRHLTGLIKTTPLLRAATSLLQAANPKTNRVHPEIDPDRHPAGRFICSNPPLDSLPRQLRQYIRADAGNMILAADFSHFELRILAHLSRDPHLIQLLRSARSDPYRQIASLATGIEPASLTDAHRQLGKQLLFGIAYDQTLCGLSRQIDCSREEARRLRQLFDSSFPAVRSWKAGVRQFAMNHRYVTTEFGRRRDLPDAGSIDADRQEAALRQALSHVVQGTAAEHFKMRLVELSRALRPETHILLPLHDGLLVEAPNQKSEEVRDLVLSRLQVRLPGSEIPMPIRIKVDRAWT